MSWLAMIALTLSPGGPSSAGTGEGALRARDLRCEHLVEPLGVDAPRPRLSWRLAALDEARRGLAQSAYRVLVARDPRQLAQGVGDLWDSGRVASDRSYDIEYAGAELGSGARCHWMVRVWDQDGEPSDWSEPASFALGLLEPEDWQASWIGRDFPMQATSETAGLEGARWIWFAGDRPGDAPGESRAFRMAWDLPDDARLEDATLTVTADDHLRVFVNGEPVHIPEREAGTWGTPSRLEVGALLRPGRNLICVEATNRSRGPAGLIAKLVLPTAGRTPIELVSDSGWRSARAPGEGWTRPDFDDGDWPPARELGEHGAEPWGALPRDELVLPPPRYLRREFEVGGGLRRATLYASALGLYEVHLNGSRVGHDWLTPGWTDYDTRVYYNTYDVTDLLWSGANAIGVILADGWYAGYVGYGGRREHYGGLTRLRAQLVLEYSDGRSEVIGTDESWRAKRGPLLEADLLMGETYDARRELLGWTMPGFGDWLWSQVDSWWSLVLITPAIDAEVQAYPCQPVGILETFRPVSIDEPQPGVWVLDLGQNIAGVARLALRGEEGQEVTLRYGERLNPDGTLYTQNLRGARCTDRYTCSGTGFEVWQPRFTFHGFQYVEVTGLDGPPGPDTVVGLALGSRTPRVGSFACSDAMVERLMRNVYWTQRANFLEVPTDCPQRDERLGWTGDAQVYLRTASYLCDVQAFADKWLLDLADAQRADGQFPMVAPLKVAGDDGGPAWADAGVICPWTAYWVYGDRPLLERQYASMRRFVEFCRGRSTDALLPPEEFHCFGDWLHVDDPTPHEVLYTAYFARSADLLARAAGELGNAEDQRRYRDLFEAIAAAFQWAYVDAEGRIEGDSQTGYALALAFDLVDGELRDLAAAHLVRRLEERDGHLSTGFVGTRHLLPALSKIGRDDLAYRLLHNRDYPSWGFTIENGATSIWERWNGWTPEGGFADPGMNSFAHYAFGAVGEWIFQTIGGVDALAPGYDRILIRPRPGGELTWARTSFESLHGTIATHWELLEDGLRLGVTLPPNTTARIHVPAAPGEMVREGEGLAREAEGLTLVAREDDAAIFEALPGIYRFRVVRTD